MPINLNINTLFGWRDKGEEIVKMRREKIAFPLFGWHDHHFAINPNLGGKRWEKREIEMILNFIL